MDEVGANVQFLAVLEFILLSILTFSNKNLDCFYAHDTVFSARLKYYSF